MELTMNTMFDHRIFEFLEQCRDGYILSWYPNIHDKINDYISRIKEEMEKIKANPIVLPEQVHTHNLTLNAEEYGGDISEEGYIHIHWDAAKLQDMTHSLEKQTFPPKYFIKSLFCWDYDASHLLNNEPIIALEDEYNEDQYFFIGDSAVRLHARIREGDYLTLDGWEFPAEQHLNAMISDLDRTLYKVACNTKMLFRFCAKCLDDYDYEYGEDDYNEYELEDEIHLKAKEFEKCLYNV